MQKSSDGMRSGTTAVRKDSKRLEDGTILHGCNKRPIHRKKERKKEKNPSQRAASPHPLASSFNPISVPIESESSPIQSTSDSESHVIPDTSVKCATATANQSNPCTHSNTRNTTKYKTNPTNQPTYVS
jgi:hypothetical protein